MKLRYVLGAPVVLASIAALAMPVLAASSRISDETQSGSPDLHHHGHGMMSGGMMGGGCASMMQSMNDGGRRPNEQWRNPPPEDDPTPR